jgi:NADPH:quinone reductase-like Zn-dependent oxidoreductase
MSKAVQFDLYGGIDVLHVRAVPRPVPGAGEVLVQVRAAGINPSEAVIRSGALHHSSRRRFRPAKAAISQEWWPNLAPASAVLLSATK